MSKCAVNKIAVTGCGCVCAAGPDTDSVWRAVQAGSVHNHAGSEHLFPGKQNVPVFSIQGLSLPDSFADVSQERGSAELNRTFLLTLTAVAEAIASAELDVELLREKRVGIALGTTVGCTFHNETYYIDWKKGNNPDLAPVYRYLSANFAYRGEESLCVCGLGRCEADSRLCT